MIYRNAVQIIQVFRTRKCHLKIHNEQKIQKNISRFPHYLAVIF